MRSRNETQHEAVLHEIVGGSLETYVDENLPGQIPDNESLNI